MFIQVQCSQCPRLIHAPPRLAGKRCRCPECGAIVCIPAEVSAEAEYRLAPAEPPFDPPPRQVLPRRTQEERLPPSALPKPAGLGAREAAPSQPLPQSAARTRPSQPPVDMSAAAWMKQSLHIRRREARRRAGQPRFFLFAATLLPLALSILLGRGDTQERLQRTFDAHPEAAAELERAGSLDAALDLLPQRRIEGALLPRDSMVHWLYAAAASLLFFSLILLLFDPGNALLPHWLGVGFVTSTLGIFLLVSLQIAATIGRVVPDGGLSSALFQVMRLIGFSYEAALDPHNGFLLSLVGFTLGVGLCEELTKALPLLWRCRSARELDWRAACVWGLASGVGFGIAEGVMYSADYYNGIASGELYVVRFVSCVALHAIWAGAIGICLARLRHSLGPRPHWPSWALGLIRALAVPILLHGLYDTLLKRELNGAALVVAALSFAWLAWLTHQTVVEERRAYQAVVRGWT